MLNSVDLIANSKIYAAFDPSSVAVGYALAQGDQLIDSGTHKPPNDRKIEKDLRAQKRLASIFRFADNFFSKHDVDVVVLEIPAGDHGNRRTDRLVARAGAMIEAAAFKWGIDPENIMRIYPTQIKSMGIHKNALRAAKAEVVRGYNLRGEEAPMHYEIDMDGDQADAIGAWRYAFTMQRQANLIALSRRS